MERQHDNTKLLMVAIAALWHLLRNLIRDLGAPALDNRQRDENEQARDDDLLDAWSDEDGMDATGL